MTPNTTLKKIELEALGRRRFEADFTAGRVSSDGGAMLLRALDQRLRLTERLANCFEDFRNPDRVEHSVRELVAQRVFGLVLGYEDLNDHEQLCRDPLLAAVVGKTDPEGQQREREKDRGKGLASPSTLGRIEPTPETAGTHSRYEKVLCDFDAVGKLFVDLFIESFDAAPSVVIVDLDPSDVSLHGDQEQRFYHGYYRQHCYLPMYVFSGEHPLAMQLRPSNIDGAKGADTLVAGLVARLRTAWPETRIILRADSGFCREGLMSWCEATQGVDYVFGIARNKRLEAAIAQQMETARREYLQTGRAARRFRGFHYRTRKSWSRRRRVVGKAEYLSKGANPRFVVTSLPMSEYEYNSAAPPLERAQGIGPSGDSAHASKPANRRLMATSDTHRTSCSLEPCPFRTLPAPDKLIRGGGDRCRLGHR